MMDMLKERLPALTDDQHIKLLRYYELMMEGNSRMNLTAITEPEEALSKHFIDSLSAAPHIPKGARCIDVGSGAGLPGIPLLIARGDIQMTLLDCLRKRVQFLEETCAALNLRVQCVHLRAEDAGRGANHRERYDIALSRAVAPLNALLELTVPFVRVGGAALCYKGKAAQQEAKDAKSAAELLGCTLETVHVEADYGARNLVIARKHSLTPPGYPRRPGDPLKKPL